jgi:hypothetical protein
MFFFSFLVVDIALQLKCSFLFPCGTRSCRSDTPPIISHYSYDGGGRGSLGIWAVPRGHNARLSSAHGPLFDSSIKVAQGHNALLSFWQPTPHQKTPPFVRP